MHLLDLPPEILSIIVNNTDKDTLLSLCLTEKHTLCQIARSCLEQNVTVVFDVGRKPRPDVFSFGSGRLSAIRSLSLIDHGSFALHSELYSPVFIRMVNLNHVRVIGGPGTLIRSIVESTTASLTTLELEECDAEPQDFSEMASVAIRRLSISRCHSNVRFILGPLTVEELEVHGPSLDEECTHVGVALRRLTDGNLKRLHLINTCRDPGCRDVLHLAHALETQPTRFPSLEVLILDIPLSQDTMEKLFRTVSVYPALKRLYLDGISLSRPFKLFGNGPDGLCLTLDMISFATSIL
ncbi:uncharacterized protein EV420DRAFT_1761572 [Desarmillaria tabescens]|uniref:F-box domain-containing protein n=1 Tax=Armillaria tabescens TaxID=1929756 RepID=A0AA39TXF8_ARMTA|nr:uncharacterized protein EV420DRAFT_1761572 [Desarmillaria tabescens]KAK0462300.1 hypothetical protein EV420DRAFT_1761572 [Desarmillaria tabescens]